MSGAAGGSPAAAEDPLQEALARHGHEAFRPGQREALEGVLAGRDVVVVMPTGSGKSLVFQLAAELLDGPVLVISPLLALIADQVDGLERAGVAAARLDGGRASARRRRALGSLQAGEARIAYLTPEQLDDDDLVEALAALRPGLVAVDEAHVVSEWGRGFRPAFLAIGDAIGRLGRPPAGAFTATADPYVRRDIVETLRLRDPLEVIRGIARPELFLEVLRVERARDEWREVRRLLVGDPDDPDAPPPLDGKGIVYVRTTRAAADTARRLREAGLAADHYHGGRRARDRERVQDGFREGAIRVVVATNAFGLGVDVPDVRWVVHQNVPASLEAYHQEAGRGGRDGRPARCTLVFRPAALGKAAFQAASGRVTRDELRAVAEALRAGPALTRRDLARASGLTTGRAARALELLEEEGMAGRAGRRVRATDALDPFAVSLEREERREAYERDRVEMMRAYAESDGCRRRLLLEYFGEPPGEGPCGNCDNDLAGRDEDAPPDDLPAWLAPGREVRHGEFGHGVVRGADGDELLVAFDDHGLRTLSLELVAGGRLLAPAPGSR